MAAIGTWMHETYRTYVGNAGATRDFRVQLRGNRSMILFGVYLVMLIGIAIYTYGETSRHSGSIIEVQRRLKDFYVVINFTLATMICLITPALSATTVVIERQRRSLDLVFSAPVTPKYFLVGKMLAVYRYAWMLLALSLPVTATCVVLGGANWSDVLTSYGLLSMHALVLGAIALLVSTITAKPVAAVLWSYGACAGYLGLSAAFAATGLTSLIMSGSSAEVNFLVTMNPFFVAYAPGATFTMISGHQVPNWALALAATLVITKFLLHNAGAVMASAGSKDIPTLRIWGLLLGWACAFGIGSIVGSVVNYGGQNPIGLIIGLTSLPLIFAIPTLSAYGFDGAHRNEPNGWFSFRRMFDGTPASGLPFMLTYLIGASAVLVAGFCWQQHGLVVPAVMYRQSIPASVYDSNPIPVSPITVSGTITTALIYTFYTTAFWVMLWAVGRLGSSFLTGMKTARVMPFLVVVALCAVPAPVLVALDGPGASSDDPSLWYFYILRPVLSTGHSSLEGTLALIDGVVMFAIAAALTIASESILKRKLKEMKKDESTIAPAQAI